MKKLIITITLCALLPFIVNGKHKTIILKNTDSKAMNEWVDSVYNSLSTEEKIGQLIAQAVAPKDLQKAKDEIKLLVDKYNIGCIYFSPGPAKNHAELVNYTNSISKTPIFVAIDGEWGLSMRMPNTPRFPKNMMLGAIQNDKLLYEYGAEIAKECKALGISVNFAPVLDVNSNPNNPVIGTRSFGEKPSNVSSKAIAYSRGLEDNGVMSVSKHFPGHGDTHDDSHKTLPLVERSLIELQSSDLIPFKNYFKAGLSGVMIAHLNIPALKTGKLPSSLCSSVVTKLLKEDMGFKGLVFTDALTMKGAIVEDEPNGLLALRAGAEVLLEPRNLPKNFKAMIKAYEEGGNDKILIENACKKILRYKYALNLQNSKEIDATAAEKSVNTRSAELVMRKLFAAGITALKNENDILPIKHLDKTVAVINIGDDAFNKFTETCGLYTTVNKYAMNAANASSIAEKVKDAATVIVGIYTRDQWAATCLDMIVKSAGAEKVVPVFFTTPYTLSKHKTAVDACNTAVIAYEKVDLAQEYAAQAIFGGSEISGKTPVSIEGLAKCGTGVIIKPSRIGYGIAEEVGLDEKFIFQADSLATEGIKQGAYTGCQVLVAKNGKIVFNRNYGYTDNKKKIKVTANTIFDLASVSKATGTLPAIMKTIDLGNMHLNDKLEKFIPELKGTEKGNFLIKDILYHETGMPAALNIYKEMTDSLSFTGKLVGGKRTVVFTKQAGGGFLNKDAKVRRDIISDHKTDAFNYQLGKKLFVGQVTYDTIMQKIHNIKLRDNKNYLYSCLNFCLLMEAEENANNTKHDKFLYEQIYRPLGAFRTCYKPLEKFDKAEIAATEIDEYFRDGVIVGTVHDETAAFSAGVQGNAGLFSTANDLAKYCSMLLNKGAYGGTQIIAPDVVKTFMTSQSKNSHRGLGFDKPNTEKPERSSTCEEAPACVVGHTGYTGTSFWIDPENDIIYIFLSNRVCPTRNNPAFSKVGARAGIFGLVYQSIERVNNTAKRATY